MSEQPVDEQSSVPFGRALGLLMALAPFGVIWLMVGIDGIAGGAVAGFFEDSWLLWLGIIAMTLGGGFALLNLHLSYIRPYLHAKRDPEFANFEDISGVPLLATFFLSFASWPFLPDIWPAILASVLMFIDTSGIHWFVVFTWRDDSFWKGGSGTAG
jgi:hypothetical protein